MRSKRTIEEVDKDSSGIEALPSPSDSASQGTTKKSWVWQYFKPTTINGVSYNVCQVNKTPGGTNLCLAKLAIDKKGSTKSMSNHLDQQHRVYKGKSDAGVITKFIKTGKIAKKLN
jgi:hypothetical protein